MWQRLLPHLVEFWSKLWPALVASGITAGFLYLFKRREERRDLKKKLSAEIYIPARRQLSDALQAIQNNQRANQIDSEMWKRARATGMANKVKPALRVQLAELYENALPNHDRDWQSLNVEIGRIAGEWDLRYADIRDHATAAKEHSIVEVRWWNFLTGDTPATPIDGLREGNVMRLWNGFMTPARFKLLDLTVEQFLIQRWQEAARNEVLRGYKESRRRAIATIPPAVALLDRACLY
jgi:hypothetical protein